MRRNFMKKIIKIFLLGVSKIYYGLYLIKHLITPNSLRRKNKLQLKIEEDLVKETFKEFSEHFKKSLLFNDRWEIREYSIKRALSNDKRNEYYYLEFGTYKGESTNFFSRFVDKLYCFDSFEGLKEDWIGLVCAIRRTYTTSNVQRNLSHFSLSVSVRRVKCRQWIIY